jgi:hypothetical protein
MTDDTRPGAALARLRWDKATAEQRAEHGRMMALARWGPPKPPGERKRRRRKPKPPPE